MANLKLLTPQTEDHAMNALLKSITRTHAGYGISLLRIVTGLTFAAHGA